MKKFPLFVMALVAMTFYFIPLNGQVIFSEDFDGIPGPTAGGAGTYVFPAGWFLRNVDNMTPDPNVSYVNDAWERREDFNFNVADSAMFSTSWYSPAGTADDWAWTPLIGPLPANCVLSWNGVAYDPSYPDGYEVRVMTSAQGPPTGGTGVIGNQLTNSTQIFSTAAEASSWTAHSVNLSSYAGQSIYIGFRNHSTDKFLLLIDDIKVQVQVTYDAAISALDTVTEYTMTPLAQVQPLNLSGTITNNGLNALTNVSVNVDVLDGSMTSVYSASSTAIPSLAAGASSPFSVASYTPAAIDNYTIRYVVTETETDVVPSNDTAYSFALISDTTYARDDGSVTASLGIGAGGGNSYMGQDFEVVTPATLTSVSVYCTRGYTGKQLAAVIWDMPAGIPNAIIGGTDTLLYPDDSARFYTIPISNGNLLLNPGRYAVTMIEFDSTLAIGQTNNIFTTNRTWINWPGNPFSGWASNEDFGASYAKPYVIRANFGCSLSASATSTYASCISCSDGTATAMVNGGTGSYTYAWSSGGTGATENNLAGGTYTLTVTDSNTGCSSTTTVTVNACSVAATATSTNASCGACADGTAAAHPSGGVGNYTYIWTPGGQITDSISGLTPGTYTVTVTDSVGCSDTAIVTINFSTGISNMYSGNSLSIYPNPASEKLHFEIGFAETQDMKITLTNVLGETVYSESHSGSHYSNDIALGGFAKGVYFFEVKTESSSKMVKVVIQ